jgi:nucleoside-diphosphate-sugar epimerase
VKVLVTGSAGFVGRHLLAHLADRHPGADVHTVDIAHGVDARDFFRHSATHYDLVLHLAAVVGGRVQIEGDPLSLAVDLAIDAEMFGWATRTRPGKVVYFSSSAAYPTALQGLGDARRLWEDAIDLAAIASPDHLYGWAKLTGEVLAGHACRAGLDVLVVRPFSGYGPDQDPAYPFPAFIARAARREDPFDIWGDGQQVRDFIHIDDICRAVLVTVDQDIAGPLNLGTGRATSFDELAWLVTQAAGYEPRFRHLPAQPTGVQYRVADPTRMLGCYQPTITLEQGIAEALEDAEAAAA